MTLTLISTEPSTLSPCPDIDADGAYAPCDAPRLYLQTLGGLRVFHNDRPVPIPWQGTKALDLFLCLAAGAGRRLHRDEIIHAVWGGGAVDRSRLNLFRMTLSRMRKSFHLAGLTCPVAGSGDHFELNLQMADLDILQFREHALEGLKLLERSGKRDEALAHLESAVDLYGGTFLRGEPASNPVLAARGLYEQLYRTVKNRLENLYLSDQRLAALDMLRLIEACHDVFGGSTSYHLASGQ